VSALDERIAGEIGEIANAAFAVDSPWESIAEWPHGVPSIPIIGTIDSETGAITHHAPLPESPAPLTEENYAAGRMPFWAWLIGALGIGVAVAIAAVMVLVDRVRRRA
jgi:hypothetical protein